MPGIHLLCCLYLIPSWILLDGAAIMAHQGQKTLFPVFFFFTINKWFVVSFCPPCSVLSWFWFTEMSCSALQSGIGEKAAIPVPEEAGHSLISETPIPSFQSNRFLYTGSLRATCVIFQVMTPKWGRSTSPPLLWDANPNT